MSGKEATGVVEESGSLQGMVASREDEAQLLGALEKAFDYRGDVTLTLADGRAVTGYIFDREVGETLAESSVRLFLQKPRADGSERVRVSFDTIAQLEFSGKDAAHGKSFEGWVKRYVEKKLAGQKASIESEPLDG